MSQTAQTIELEAAQTPTAETATEVGPGEGTGLGGRYLTYADNSLPSVHPCLPC